MKFVRSTTRRSLVVLACAGASVVTLVGGGTAALASAGHDGGRDPSPGRPATSRLAPTVQHTGKAPTGYTVTFRYYAPQATRVQIKGEWSFEDPSALPSLASTPGHLLQTPGLLPQQWKPGDVPIQSPNSTDPNFPVLDMKQQGHSGVWTFTTPLPSGQFDYGFYVDCASSTQAGCTEVPDPANPTWATRTGVVDASSIALSTVLVPSDPRFGTVDYSWQAPAAGAHGKLVHLTYSSPGHVTPVDANYAVVYTPPNYQPHRAKPYPTLYLNHGGGENELGWSIQGDLQNIMDNLIDTGQAQPMVVVMPNANGYPGSTDNAAYRADLITRLIPFIEQRYHVSTAAGDRAFSGLSLGGQLTNQLLLNDTAAFGYYGVMSAGLAPGTTLTAAQVVAIKKTRVFLGAGWQDSIFADGFTVGGNQIHTGPAREVRTLADATIPVATDFINGGHEWYVWRILLKDFVTRTAFWPSPAAEWSTGG